MADEPKMRKLQVDIPEDTHRFLRTYAADKDLTLGQVLVIALNLLKKNGPEGDGAKWAVEILSAMADNTFGERRMVLLDAAREIAKRSK